MSRSVGPLQAERAMRRKRAEVMGKTLLAGIAGIPYQVSTSIFKTGAWNGSGAGSLLTFQPIKLQ
jgi:hypothetical protein